MKRNSPRNDLPHRRSNHSRRYGNTYQPTVQHINNNVNVSFDMCSDQGSGSEDNGHQSNNITSIATRDHQDQNYNERGSSTRRYPGPNTSTSTNHQRNDHLWDHPRLPRDSSEYDTGRRGDYRMQRGCPNGTRPSECETSDNNLNSPRSPSGMSAPHGSSMLDHIEAEILWRTQSSRQDEMIWPSGNNSWYRVESIAEN